MKAELSERAANLVGLPSLASKVCSPLTYPLPPPLPPIFVLVEVFQRLVCPFQPIIASSFDCLLSRSVSGQSRASSPPSARRANSRPCSSGFLLVFLVLPSAALLTAIYLCSFAFFAVKTDEPRLEAAGLVIGSRRKKTRRRSVEKQQWYKAVPGAEDQEPCVGQQDTAMAREEGQVENTTFLCFFFKLRRRLPPSCTRHFVLSSARAAPPDAGPGAPNAVSRRRLP